MTKEKKVEEQKCPIWCSSLGDYNHLPEPYVECDIGEFWYTFFSYSAEQEYRQCEAPWLTDKTWYGMKPIRSCRIFWFYDRCYALFHPDNWDCNGKADKLRYTEQPRCYRIGCIHEYKRTTLKMHNHIDKCNKCGISYSVDSSD